jgi:hypothetical protein
MEMAETCTLARIRSLYCVNADCKPIENVLPGETISVDLLVETLQKDVLVAVRLELDAPPIMIFAAEPLIPFAAAEQGQYLFRARIDGWLMAHNAEAALYKFRTRVLLKKPGTDTKEMTIATIRFSVRGDLRYAFDEWRHNQGEAETSVLNPTPAFLGDPEAVPEFDEPSDIAPTSRRALLNRRPLLRPRLNWSVFQVSPATNLDAAQAPLEAPHTS